MVPRRRYDPSARALLRWQFQRAHEFLAVATAWLPAEAVRRHPSSVIAAVAASYARLVVSEDLTINGVLANGSPLALSTWVGRTGLSEIPSCATAAEWDAWAQRVPLELSRLRLYAQAVHASTDTYIAHLPEGALDPLHEGGPGCVLNALLLTLSMRTGEIGCLLALDRGRAARKERQYHCQECHSQR